MPCFFLLSLKPFFDFFLFLRTFRRPLRARRKAVPLTMRRRPASLIALFFLVCCCCCPSPSSAQNSSNSSSTTKNALLLFASPPEAPSLRQAPSFRPAPGAPLRVVARLKPIGDSSVKPNVREIKVGVELSVVFFLFSFAPRLAPSVSLFLSPALFSLNLFDPRPLGSPSRNLFFRAAGVSNLPRWLPGAPDDDPDAAPPRIIRPLGVRGRDPSRRARKGGAPPLGSDGNDGGGLFFFFFFSFSFSFSFSSIHSLPSPRRRLARHRRPRPRGALQAAPGRVVPRAQPLRRRRRRRRGKRKRRLAVFQRSAAPARGRVKEGDDVAGLAQAEAQARVQEGVRHRGEQRRRKAGAEASLCVRGGRARRWGRGGSDGKGRPRFSLVGAGLQQLREASGGVRGAAQQEREKKKKKKTLTRTHSLSFLKTKQNKKQKRPRPC